VHGSLSVPLRAGGLTAAVNLYATQTGAFGDASAEAARDLVGYTAAVLSVSEQRERATMLADQLQTAMDSRAVIEQAKGILMAKHGLNADAAFDALVRISQESHRKLRDVAYQLVEQTRAG
jgi:AmiR/NasT family two-component response regulator